MLFVYHLFKGIGIGFAVAAAVGPICLLCLRRALTDGKLVGFVSGLGVATADAIYGGLAALGLSAVISTLAREHAWGFQIFGGLFLIYLGVHTARAKPPAADVRRPEHAPSLHAAYFTTLVLTLANPMTIIAFAAILAAAGLSPDADTLTQSAFLVGGIFLGSSTWWLILSVCAGWFGRNLSPATMTWINRIAGAAIVLFGFAQLAGLSSKILT